jgi:hypothetical protein
MSHPELSELRLSDYGKISKDVMTVSQAKLYPAYSIKSGRKIFFDRFFDKNLKNNPNLQNSK